MMQVGLSNYQFGNSNVVARANNKKAEKKTEDKYASVSAYQAYLKDKYPCLSASNYKVTISPALLEKCIRDPEKAELLEKNLEILPGCHQNMIAAWNALGADVKNEEWIFYEDGTAGLICMLLTAIHHQIAALRIKCRRKKVRERKLPHRGIMKRENS